jgi:hypothetical protein
LDDIRISSAGAGFPKYAALAPTDLPKKMLPRRFRNIGVKHGASPVLFADHPCVIQRSIMTAASSYATQVRLGSCGQRLWLEKRIIERFVSGDGTLEYSPITLMRLMLVQTWRPFAASRSYENSIGWVIGTIFPDFDVLAKPIKRRITHRAISTLPIHFRPALLAGISRVMNNPDIFQELRNATTFRGRKNFDRFYLKAKIADVGSEKSHQL